MNDRENEQSQNISRNLRTLIRGLTQDNVKEMYEGYRSLFQIGSAVIPQVRDAVLKSDWSKVKYANEIRYVSGLVNLIHDLDEVEAGRVTDQLKSNGCDPAVAHLLDSIRRFTLADYTQYDVCGVKIFEHKKLAARQNVRAALEQWLKNVPGQDLTDVQRLYVLRREDLKSSGNYTPILYQINLVWDNPSSWWSPMSWINNYIIETTLYHEIGHHVHRHTFGQEPEQEKEAESYSTKIMANSNRLFSKIARALSASKS